jgi:hypothetical protein
MQKYVWGPHRRVVLKLQRRQRSVRIYRHNIFDTKSEIQPDFWQPPPPRDNKAPWSRIYIAIASNRPWYSTCVGWSHWNICWLIMSIDMGLSSRVESLSLVLYNHNYFSFTVHVKHKTAVIAVESQYELGVIPSTYLCQTTYSLKFS